MKYALCIKKIMISAMFKNDWNIISYILISSCVPNHTTSMCAINGNGLWVDLNLNKKYTS